MVGNAPFILSSFKLSGALVGERKKASLAKPWVVVGAKGWTGRERDVGTKEENRGKGKKGQRRRYRAGNRGKKVRKEEERDDRALRAIRQILYIGG